jgi:hypothetical protein
MNSHLGWPSVEVPATADLARVFNEAGGTTCIYDNGRLYVEGVTQKALDAALKTAGTAPAAPVPLSITPLQARRALRGAGLLEQIQSAIKAAGDEAVDAWEYALEVRRDDPTLTGIAAALGMSNAQVDDLFRAAAAS